MIVLTKDHNISGVSFFPQALHLAAPNISVFEIHIQPMSTKRTVILICALL